MVRIVLFNFDMALIKPDLTLTLAKAIVFFRTDWYWNHDNSTKCRLPTSKQGYCYGSGLPTNQHAIFVRVSGIFNDWNDVGAFLCHIEKVTT